MERKSRCLTCISFILIVSGLILTISSFKIFDIILDKVLDLTPDSLLYKEWIKKPPIMNLDIYFFNWTNPDEFYDKTKKPTFEEIGPYKFDITLEKTNVTYNTNNTMSYILKKWYKFNKKESITDLNEEITLINQLSTAAAYKAKSMNILFKKGLSISINSFSNIFLKKTVKQYLFDGFDDTMLDFLRGLPMIDVKIPEKFGFFYKKNGTSNGLFNIGTGRGGYKLGTLYSWNGQNKTNFYDQKCSKIEGASMDFYTENVLNKKIELFNPEMCRNIPLDFTGKGTVHGLEGFKFEIDKSFLDNGSKIIGNECFCSNQCIRYGAVPASLCKGKANSYVTLPHFLKTDNFYKKQINGMKPNMKQHQFYLLIEPVTGFLLKMKARLQLNLYIEPISGISMLEDGPTGLMPLVWFEHSIKIPEDGAFSLGILLSLKGLFACIGLIIFIIGVLIYMLFIFELGSGKKLVIKEDVDGYYNCTREMCPLNEKH